MNLLINDVNGFKTISIDGRLDTATYPELEKTLITLFDGGDHRLIIDCSGMDYVSSSGLRVFLMILKKTKTVDGQLIICGLQPAIHNIFEISGFLSIFNLTDTLAQALNHE